MPPSCGTSGSNNFAKKDQNFQTAEITTPSSVRTRSKSILLEESETPSTNFSESSDNRNSTSDNKEKVSGSSYDRISNSTQPHSPDLRRHSGAPPKYVRRFPLIIVMH